MLKLIQSLYDFSHRTGPLMNERRDPESTWLTWPVWGKRDSQEKRKRDWQTLNESLFWIHCSRLSVDHGLWVWQHYTQALTSQHPPQMSSHRLSCSVNQSRLTMPISLSWKGRGTDVRPAVSGCFNARLCVRVHKYWLMAPVHGCFMWSDRLPTGDSLWKRCSWHMACVLTNVYGAGTENPGSNACSEKCGLSERQPPKDDEYVSGSTWANSTRPAQQTHDGGDQTGMWTRWEKDSWTMGGGF